MPKKRGDAGQYVESVTLEDVRAVFDAVDGPPVVTSGDVADATGLSRDSARRKLEALRERGQVAKRKTAGRVLYWPTDWDRRDDQDQDADRQDRHATETSDTPPDATRDESAGAATEETPGGTGEGERTTETSTASRSAQGATDDARDHGQARGLLEDLDLPGRGGKLEARIDALLSMYEHLQAHAGTPVAKADLLALVDPDAVGYASEGSFWTNCVKKNSSQGRDTNALVALPGVEDWGGGEYRFTGDELPGDGVYDPTEDLEG